ncbi:MAG: hypothetical protein JWO37_2121 [Acidimicrobiales bacterium]|jgi:hypothetical protein|nr:hypothetical protein [Acidimicrobiales bacterium]
MSRQEAHVRIEASPHEVWRVLVDIDRYPRWNRYATSAVGDLRPGGEVKIVVPLWKEKRGPVNNRVTELVPNKRLCWRSLSWFKFLAYGVRCRHLEGQPDGSTVFREVETMHGAFAGVIHRLHGPHLLRGLQTECDSLKAEVERQKSADDRGRP